MVGKFSVDKIEETYSFCFTCLDLLIDLINNSKKFRTNTEFVELIILVKSKLEKVEDLFESMRSLRVTAFKRICGNAFDYNDSRCFTEFKMLFVQATQWLATSLSHNDLRWTTNLGDLGSLSFSVPEPPDFLSKIKALRQELNLEKQIILGYLRKQSGKNKLEGPKMILIEILCEYHGVNNDIDNNEPLVIRELARGEVNGFENINMSPSKISKYFKLIFPDQKVPGTVSGYALYEELCKKKLIVNYLRKLQNPADSYKKLRDQKKNDWIMKQRSTMDNLPDLD